MLALRKLRKGAVLLEVTPSHICKILLVVYTSVLFLACGVPGRSAWSEWECSWEGHGFWVLSTRSCFMEKKKGGVVICTTKRKTPRLTFFLTF